jgi:hypothetical protein
MMQYVMIRWFTYELCMLVIQFIILCNRILGKPFFCNCLFGFTLDVFEFVFAATNIYGNTKGSVKEYTSTSTYLPVRFLLDIMKHRYLLLKCTKFGTF